MNILISTIVISAIGCLLHFTYAWSHQKKFVAIISAVNESTWEHIKLGFSGIFLYSLVDGFLFGTNENYFIAKALCCLVFAALIIVLFYSIRTLLKKDYLVVDILEFIVSVFVSQLVFYRVLEMPSFGAIWNYIGIAVLFACFALYLIWTWVPPKNFLFIDPRNGKRGIHGFQHEKHHKH